jgi:uncharacterized Zn finger protein/DNA-binding transcriptional regulator YiaG
MRYYGFRPYVPVAKRRARARREMNKLRKKGVPVQPVEIDGRTIARTFWGAAWCDHLESFSDFANRLPRGRTYVRNGSVCHLKIAPGKVEAIVSGSELYNLKVRIDPLPKRKWQEIRSRCAGKIGSLLGLLAGKLSEDVLSVVTDRREGLFPLPGEIHFRCSCPDWAFMCKHVAAVMYGVGHRLDARPELLFALRQVDQEELISTEGSVDAVVEGTGSASGRRTLRADQLGEVFGIDLGDGEDGSPSTPSHLASPKAVDDAGGQKAPRPRGHRARRGSTRGGKQDSSKKRSASRMTGKSVARLRKKLGMSVAEFAEFVGVSPASVYRWESETGRLCLRARTSELLVALKGRGASGRAGGRGKTP